MPHFYGAVGAPNVGHHEWQPHSRRPLVADDVRFSQGARLFLYETRLFLNEIRWRRRPPEYGLRIVACAMVVLVHLFLLFLMLAVQPPGYLPPEGSPEVTTLDVRLISQPEPPPPPPPPIKLPKRHVKKTVRHVPVKVKRAPVAAMPPIPQVATATPTIKLTPAKPDIAQPKPQPQPVQQAAASPQVPTPTPQVELSPAPPKVVLEPSKMAVSPPQLADTQMAPLSVPSPALQAVPTMRTAPVVELGNPKLATVQPGQIQGVAALSAKVEASTPEIPTVDTSPTAVRITATPMTQPSISTPQVTLHAVTAPTAELAPIPQTPDTTPAAPSLDLPMAQVPEPQAPDVQAPSVHVEMPSVAAETVSQPAPASSTRKITASPRTTAKTWAPANDQFKPVGSSHQGEQGATKRPGSKPAGTVQLMPRGNSDVMTRNSDHLGYKPTIFDQYWAPDNESILDTFLRHLIEKLTVMHTFHLAPGVRVKCALGPMAIFLACGDADGPRPKSAKSNDPRLNMAPARPLVPGLGTSSPAPSTTAPLHLDNSVKCSVARVAGGPPPPGCPGAPVKPSQSDQWHVQGE
ncbi:MAG TPA: hypothetical protein VFG67_02685 [Oleiagrimonas sp.]|nr:hypothetical protein [Oleiagrimonas sp.]